MNRIFVVALVVLVAVGTACSGGSSGDPVGPGAGISAGFIPDEPNPGSDTVSAAEGSTGGNLVTVSINVTDTNGIYGASFTLNYVPSNANYVDFTFGNLFEQGGHTPTYIVQDQNGQLVVAVSRLGAVPEVNASGTRTIIGLTFEVIQEGDSIVSFVAQNLTDDQVIPIPDIVWSGGYLSGN